MNKIDDSMKQLYDEINDQAQQNIDSSIPLSKLELLIQHVKCEEIEEKGTCGTSQDAFDELDESDTNDNLETNVKQEETTNPQLVLKGKIMSIS